MASKLRIGIFGGAFDPVHIGHVAICQYLADHDLVDRIVVIPCWKHPFEKSLTPYNQRFMMCRVAFDGRPCVELSTIEKDLGGTSYTARTIQALQKDHADASFHLIVGADTAGAIDSWHAADWLKQHVELITIPRGATGPIPDVSSSVIRQRIAVGKSIDTLVPAIVASYIDDHGLYASPA